jgi:predicted outer membrane lipoprotein
MKQIVKAWDIFLYGIQGMILSLLVKLGPFLVAIMPGLFTGYAIYFRFLAEAGYGLALAFAVITALALETVGIVSTHTAISLYNAMTRGIVKPVKFKLMAWLVPVYVGGVSSVVYFSGDVFTDLVRSLGVASPVLTCIVYIAVALARDITQIEEAQEAIEIKEDDSEADEQTRQRLIEDEERQHRYAQEAAESERKHEARMAKINVNQSVQSVNQSVQIDSVNDDPRSVKISPNGVQNDVFYNVNLSKENKKKILFAKLIDIYVDSPKEGVSSVANSLGVSRQTIYNYKRELIESGRIIENGHGVEVINPINQ